MKQYLHYMCTNPVIKVNSLCLHQILTEMRGVLSLRCLLFAPAGAAARHDSLGTEIRHLSVCFQSAPTTAKHTHM